MKHAKTPAHLSPLLQMPQRKCACGKWIWLSHYPQHREYRCPATARERAADGWDSVKLTPKFMQAQAEEAPDLARGA